MATANSRVHSIIHYLLKIYIQFNSVMCLYDRELFVTRKKDAHCIKSNGSAVRKIDIPELQSIPEEEYTKMFFVLSMPDPLDLTE